MSGLSSKAFTSATAQPASLTIEPPVRRYVSLAPQPAQRPPIGRACAPYSGFISPWHTGQATAWWAMSRRQARQLVRHGHVQVNGRKVNIPSFQCKVGDEIAIREGSKSLPILETAKEFASGQRQVQWLDVNRDNLSGKVLALPKRDDVNLPVNEQLIVELYSK